MTILPKTKKAHPKSDRHNAGRPCPNTSSSATPSASEHSSSFGIGPKHGPIGGSDAPGIDVTSGAMSTIGCVLPALGAGKKLRKHSNIVTGAQANAASGDPISRGESSAKICPKRKSQASGSAALQPQGSEKCNSDDEYGSGFKDDELDVRFAERLKKSRGLVVKEVKGDGACMFRAVADQIYGDEEMHDNVRRLCMDYIAKNRDHFSQFLTEDFDDYLVRKRQVDAHGNHVELQAISEIFSRPIEIFEYSIDPINTFHPISVEANAGVENYPIRLSYHGTVHYNSVVDPYAATIGVGLGLPDFKPGMVERNLMKEAKMMSEAQHIEEAMLNDKLRMTDWEKTDDEISKQVAKESYMAYLRQLETTPLSERRRDDSEPPPMSKAASSSSSARSHSTKSFVLGSKRGASSPNLPCSSRDDRYGHSPLAKIYRDDASSCSMPNIGAGFGASFMRNAPDLMKPSTSSSSLYQDAGASGSRSPAPSTSAAAAANSSAGAPGLYEELLASTALTFDDWGNPSAPLDETTMLAQAMALSQQEFFDSLRKSPRADRF